MYTRYNIPPFLRENETRRAEAWACGGFLVLRPLTPPWSFLESVEDLIVGIFSQLQSPEPLVV